MSAIHRILNRNESSAGPHTVVSHHSFFGIILDAKIRPEAREEVAIATPQLFKISHWFSHLLKTRSFKVPLRCA
jgi:hypothetical protein